jgi:hypothetical protein
VASIVLVLHASLSKRKPKGAPAATTATAVVECLSSVKNSAKSDKLPAFSGLCVSELDCQYPSPPMNNPPIVVAFSVRASDFADLGPGLRSGRGSKPKDAVTEAGKMELRYDLGLGDVTLRFDQIHLNAKGGRIPLIDFALALNDITNRPIEEDGPATFEFAELDATLCFDRKGSNLVISVSYLQGQIEVPFGFFREQVERFEAGKELQERYPALARNQTFQELFAVGNG